MLGGKKVPRKTQAWFIYIYILKDWGRGVGGGEGDEMPPFRLTFVHFPGTISRDKEPTKTLFLLHCLDGMVLNEFKC